MINFPGRSRFAVFVGVILTPLYSVAAISSDSHTVGVSPKTISLLTDSSGKVSLAVTIACKAYWRDQTLEKMRRAFERGDDKTWSKTPEGIECRIETFRTKAKPSQADVDTYLGLCAPDYRDGVAKKVMRQAQLQLPLPPMQLLHQWRFGCYTALAVKAAQASRDDPFSNGTFLDLLIRNKDGYQIENADPKQFDFSTRCFLILASQYEDLSGYVSPEAMRKEHCITVHYAPADENRVLSSDLPQDGFTVHALLQAAKVGPFFNFGDTLISTMANGSDDQIRALFDQADSFTVRQLFETLNDQEETRQLRRDLREDHSPLFYVVAGSQTAYLLIVMDMPAHSKVVELSPSIQCSRNRQLFLFRCSFNAGLIRLTESENVHLSDMAEQVLGDTSVGALIQPSSAVRDLVEAIPSN